MKIKGRTPGTITMNRYTEGFSSAQLLSGLFQYTIILPVYHTLVYNGVPNWFPVPIFWLGKLTGHQKLPVEIPKLILMFYR